MLQRRTHGTARKAAVALMTFALNFAIYAGGASAAALHPIKVNKQELAGPVFDRDDAVHENEDGNDTVDVTTFTSPDKAFQTGVFKSGPVREEIRSAPGYPYTELLVFLSGGAKFTSSDGTVVEAGPGEAVTLPKGWTGVFESKGYTKLYAVYDTDAPSHIDQ
ncbi:cupin [Pandoraea sputorum]|uniref:cupin domain-containing protein n=1 Tax=Pandoraea sputorum TaxID=93222 RepID=UPI001E2AD402|nr:cupin domain-containing protein [Pandoraea sputorum]MCE4060163.1 cupin [Pandoraea sputorum]